MTIKQSRGRSAIHKHKKLTHKRKAAPLARAVWPIYKQAQADTMLADAGTEERALLYFIITAKEKTPYKAFKSLARAIVQLNLLSTHYSQGRTFYLSHSYKRTSHKELIRRRCIKCRVDHAPLLEIDLRQLSTARYNPASYKNQVIL